MAAWRAHRRGAARSDRATPARRSRAAHTADRATSACAARARWRRANPASSSNSPIAADVVSSNSPASIDQANQALRRFWPINCQECSNSSAHSGRASTSGPNSTPGELKATTVMREQYREHRLLPADDRARQLIEGPEGDDGADLRQQIDAEHVIAGGAEGDVGEPERQRRTEIRFRPGIPGRRPARSRGRRAGCDRAASAGSAKAPAWSSTTSQTTSRGRARISSTTSEVKRMKRPNARAEQPCPSNPGRLIERAQPPRQPASDRDRNPGRSRFHGDR